MQATSSRWQRSSLFAQALRLDWGLIPASLKQPAIWLSSSCPVVKQAATTAAAEQISSKPHVVNLVRQAGVDFGDLHGFEDFRRRGPLCARLAKGLKPKVLILHRLGILDAAQTETVLRRYGWKWLLSRKLTNVMRENVRYLTDTLHFSDANLRKIINQNPDVLTPKMKTEEGNIANSLTRSFSVTLAELKIMVHMYPRLLTLNPKSPSRLKAWMKRVGLDSVAIRTVVRKLPNILGMRSKEYSAMKSTLELLDEMLLKGSNIPDQKRSMHRLLVSNTVSLYPRILAEGENLVDFQRRMKENDYNDTTISKVLNKCPSVISDASDSIKKLNYLLKAKHRSIEDVVRDPTVLCKPLESIIMKRFEFLMQHGVNHALFDLRAIVLSGDHDFVSLDKTMSLEKYVRIEDHS